HGGALVRGCYAGEHMNLLASSLRDAFSKASHFASWTSYALYGGFSATLRERFRSRDVSASRGRYGTPWAISFLVTARCPLKCQHCFYHYATSTPETELSLDEYRALSRSLDRFTVA